MRVTIKGQAAITPCVKFSRNQGVDEALMVVDQGATRTIEWGHLRAGEFRFMFTPTRNLATNLKSELPSDESSLEDDETLRDSSELSAVADMYASSNRRTTDKLMAMAAKSASKVTKMGNEVAHRSKQALRQAQTAAGRVAIQVAKASHNLDGRESSSDDEDSELQVPAWASECGFKLLLRGTVALEGLKPDSNMTKSQPRDWRAHPQLIEHVVRMLNPRSVGLAVKLGKSWAKAGYADPLFFDLTYIGQPKATVLAHAHRVDSVCQHSGFILSSGEKRVLAFRGDTAEFICNTPLRDTSIVSKVLVAHGSLWSASTNGAIREWSLPHDIQQIEFRAQLWEHRKAVNDVCQATVDADSSNKLNSRLVSCSDDRTVRVWNVLTKHCEAIICPFNHFSATMRSVCVSDKHLYVGSSNGCVYVYSANGETRRLANKQKKRVGVSALFPLEIELNNGDSIVAEIRTSPSYAAFDNHHSKLYIASYDGSLRIWVIPAKTLNFELLHTIADHTDRITALHVTRHHVVTASDDCTIRFYGLYHDKTYVPERLLHTESRIKCLDFSDSPSSSEYAGTLVCGCVEINLYLVLVPAPSIMSHVCLRQDVQWLPSFISMWAKHMMLAWRCASREPIPHST